LLVAMMMVLFTLQACEKSEADFIQPSEKAGIVAGTPDCIIGIINKIKREPVRNPPARVYKYWYNRQMVYYVTSYCCDIPSDLYDVNCNLICHPEGGITGSGDGRCADFFEVAGSRKLVWADNRKY